MLDHLDALLAMAKERHGSDIYGARGKPLSGCLTEHADHVYLWYNDPATDSTAVVRIKKEQKKMTKKVGRPPSDTVRVTVYVDRFKLKRITGFGKYSHQAAIHKIIDEKLFREDLHAEIESDIKNAEI
jgi:hypothetical protein